MKLRFNFSVFLLNFESFFVFNKLIQNFLFNFFIYVNDFCMSEINNFVNNSNVKYLRVIADMRPNSKIMPIKVVYEDKEYEVSEVIDIKRYVVPAICQLCHAYYCKFKEKLKILYLDGDYNWFVVSSSNSSS